jgi:hypothetical protein
MEKPLSTFSKLLLIGAGGLAVVAGPILFLFPEDTASYFAWAIKNPLTPVFMGANYFGGIGAIWAMRTNRWSVARTLLPGIFVFALTQLFATLLHVPIFNWGHPVAWAWLFVYITSPVAAAIVILQMERAYRPPPFQFEGVAHAFRPVMLTFATVSGIVGLTLFLWPAVFPTSASAGAVPWWAWSLTPLTARVVGGWYLAAAALYATLSRPHPPEAVRVALIGVICATGLELIGALLHRGSFDGPILITGLYLINAAAVTGFALFTWFGVSRAAPITTTKAV